jgi:hypothetical protein
VSYTVVLTLKARATRADRVKFRWGRFDETSHLMMIYRAGNATELLRAADRVVSTRPPNLKTGFGFWWARMIGWLYANLRG